MRCRWDCSGERKPVTLDRAKWLERALVVNDVKCIRGAGLCVLYLLCSIRAGTYSIIRFA
jgi:hypothetical protein